MRKLLFFLAMIPLCSMAQSRYCATWQDFLDGNWKEAEGRVELVPSAKEDPLAMDIEADKKRTAGILRKRAIVLSQHDSLYINLRPFNTFGDVYVRAWRVGSDKLLFARQDVAPSRFSVTYGGTNTPLNSNSFRTFSRVPRLLSCRLESPSRRAQHGTPHASDGTSVAHQSPPAAYRLRTDRQEPPGRCRCHHHHPPSSRRDRALI